MRRRVKTPVNRRPFRTRKVNLNVIDRERRLFRRKHLDAMAGPSAIEPPPPE